MTLSDAVPPTDPELDEFDAARAEVVRRRAILGLVGVFLAVLVGIVAVQWAGEDAQPAQGDPIPAATLTSLEGAPLPLTSIVGHPTVVNFFASWCAPCRAELPEFQDVSIEVGDDVRFLGVNTRETDVAQARALIDSTGVTYPVGLGDDGTVFEAFGGLGMPTTAFVDADGRIVEVHSGVLRGKDLRDKIREHFDR